MGGQTGGMVNEAGHFPEVCKKSLQAMVADMQGAIRAEFFSTYSIAAAAALLAARAGSLRPADAAAALRRAASSYYQPISWDEALEQHRRQAQVRSQPDETFWYFSGRSSNEAGFLLQLFARLYGTNNVNNCSYYCHQASGVGLTSVARQRHRHGHARRLEQRRPGVSHRRQPGQQPSAADALADDGAAPRRRR